MAGMYTQTGFGRPQPWHAVQATPLQATALLDQIPPVRDWVQAVGAPARGELAGLGLGAVPRSGRSVRVGALTAPQYAAASLLGSTLGGAAIGFVAAGSTEGAVNGALFTAGLTGLSDAVLLAREGHTGGAALLGVAGLGSLAAGLYRGLLR
jgi:hypothetical protein